MRPVMMGLALSCWAATCFAADHFVAYNLTTTTDFASLSLAPAGTQDWGPNQVLSDKDKEWDASERLKLSGITRGRYEARLVDTKGRICVVPGIDLTKDTSFAVHDSELKSCR